MASADQKMEEIGAVEETSAAKPETGIRFLSKKWLISKAAPSALIVAITLLCYGGIVTHDLVSDDLVLIPHQEAFHDPADLQAIFGTLVWGGIREDQPIYRPIMSLSLALNHGVNKLFRYPGEHPAGYHLTDVLLHALVACLVLSLLLKTGVPFLAGLSAGLLFAAHPIHTEAIALATNRSELLGAAFGILFLLSHMNRRWFSGFLLLLALLSKESALVFFPLAIWLDFRPGGSRRTASTLSYAIPLVAVMAWLVVRSMVVGGRAPVLFKSDNPLVESSLLERIATAGGIQLDYLRLQFLPLGLSSDYAFDQIPVASGLLDAKFAGFLLIAVLFSVIAWRARHSHPFLILAVVSYGILFAVTSNFVFLIGAPMADRWAYSPSIFFCGLVGYGVWMLREWKGRATVVLFGAVLGLFVILTVDRIRTWANQEVFLETQIQSAPNSARAHHRMGRFRHDNGDLAGAILHYRRALEILPNFPYVWNDMGGAFKDRGDLVEARNHYGEAIRYNPGLARAYYGLGQIHSLEGRFDLAIASYRTALHRDTTYVEAYNNLATVYANLGQLEEAEELWLHTLELDPDYTIARDNLEKLNNIRKGLPGR